eukprot:GHVU01080427.1.p1 GENE.GHVU01080427.1~~GHVU01080427.1.p1  ORF type:complete len:106 (+),score=2.28 GHVU01080427.1:97-414(+)
MNANIIRFVANLVMNEWIRHDGTRRGVRIRFPSKREFWLSSDQVVALVAASRMRFLLLVKRWPPRREQLVLKRNFCWRLHSMSTWCIQRSIRFATTHRGVTRSWS